MVKTAGRGRRPESKVFETGGSQVPPLVFPIALFSALMIAYLPALRAGYIWDDDDYVYRNPLLSTSAGLGTLIGLRFLYYFFFTAQVESEKHTFSP